MRFLRTFLYWLAVVAVSVVLVVLLILFLESRDQADVGASAPSAALRLTPEPRGAAARRAADPPSAGRAARP